MTHELLFRIVRFYAASAAAATVVGAIALWSVIARHGLLTAVVVALLLKFWVIYESVRRRSIHTSGKLIEFDSAPGRFQVNVAAMMVVSVAATVSAFVLLYFKG